MFSLRTKSIFNYNEDAFYVDGIYCFNHYCEELMRIHNGLRASMNPDYKGLSTPRGQVQLMENSNGTVSIFEKVDDKTGRPKYDLIGPIMTEKEEKMLEVMQSIVVKKEPEPEEEDDEMQIIKMSPYKMRQKVFEDEVLHAYKSGIIKSYDIAAYVHRPRGSVYNAMRRLGLAAKSKRKGYSKFKEQEKDEKAV